MIRQHEYPNGAFVTITTRKVNHADMIFGWATIWLNRDYYNRGICEPSIEVKNYYLGYDKKELASKIDKWIDTLASDAERLIQAGRAAQVLNRISEDVSIRG